MNNGLKPLMVLFLSTHNAARSIVAEALLRAKNSDRYTARSAGFRMAPGVHDQTLQMLTAAGIETDGLHSKGWNEFLGASQIVKIDVIVTLSKEAQKTAQPSSATRSRVHWPVDDPLSMEKADIREWKFRKCFATLEARIANLVKSRTPQSPTELLLQMKDLAMVV